MDKRTDNVIGFILLVIIGALMTGTTDLLGPIHEFGHATIARIEGLTIVKITWSKITTIGKQSDKFLVAGYYAEFYFTLALSVLAWIISYPIADKLRAYWYGGLSWGMLHGVLLSTPLTRGDFAKLANPDGYLTNWKIQAVLILIIGWYAWIFTRMLYGRQTKIHKASVQVFGESKAKHDTGTR